MHITIILIITPKLISTLNQQSTDTAVVKQQLAARVIDNEMPDNAFSANEKSELLAFDVDKSNTSGERDMEVVRQTINNGLVDDVLLRVSRSRRFDGIFLDNVVVLFRVEWCIRQLWVSSTILYSITSIAYNHPSY